MKFRIEQIALYPAQTERAIEFLAAIGLTEWSRDHVKANGRVFGIEGSNEADLMFNYQAAPDSKLELEVLHYTDGPHWMQARAFSVSHLGMHVEEDELQEWMQIMDKHGVNIAQSVETESHTNPVIAGTRRYRYVIYSTRHLIGVDLKFIVRLKP